jgi:hypothetical protein
MCDKSWYIVGAIIGTMYLVWALLELIIWIVARVRKEEIGYSIALGLLYMFIKMAMIWGFFMFSCYMGDPRIEKLGFVFFLPIIWGMFQKISAQVKKNTSHVDADSTYEEFLKDIISKFINKDK